MACMAALLANSVYNLTQKQVDHPDSVSALIWLAMCMVQVLFWYFSSNRALKSDGKDRFTHALHYRLNFNSAWMMISILSVGETTWAPIVPCMGLTFVLSQILHFYSLGNNWVKFRSLLSVGFPFPYHWALTIYMSAYFYFFGATAEGLSLNNRFSYHWALSHILPLTILAGKYYIFDVYVPADAKKNTERCERVLRECHKGSAFTKDRNFVMLNKTGKPDFPNRTDCVYLD